MKSFNPTSLIYYGFYLLVATVFSFLINYLLLKFSRNLGRRDNLDDKQIRWATQSKPSLGGFSFYIVFLVSVAILGFLPFHKNLLLDTQLIGVISASSLGFVLGLADDAYNTNPLVKLMGQLTCAFILIFTNVYIQVTGNMAVDYLITTIWVVGMMNSLNMLDNMDGITASNSAVIIVSCIVSLFFTEDVANVNVILLLGVLGSLVGFLYFNWNPSRIYMGDTGSQFLGVFLAATSILFLWKFRDADAGVFQVKQFIVPALAFIVPLIDTTTVTIRRLMRRQSPFVGGRDHITHHLVYFGLNEKQVAFLLMGFSILSTIFIYLLVSQQIVWNFYLNIGVIVYGLFMFGLMQCIYNLGKKRHDKKKAS